MYAQPWYDRTVIRNNLSKENFVLAKWSTSSPHNGFFLRFLRSFLFKKLMFSNLVNITFHFVKIWMDACMSMCLCVCMYNLFGIILTAILDQTIYQLTCHQKVKSYLYPSNFGCKIIHRSFCKKNWKVFKLLLSTSSYRIFVAD